MKQKLLITLMAAAAMNVWAEGSDDPGVITITITGGSGVETRKAPGSVTVVNRKTIIQKGSANVLEAIRDTTGVNLQGIGSGQEAYRLRSSIAETRSASSGLLRYYFKRSESNGLLFTAESVRFSPTKRPLSIY